MSVLGKKKKLKLSELNSENEIKSLENHDTPKDRAYYISEKVKTTAAKRYITASCWKMSTNVIKFLQFART